MNEIETKPVQPTAEATETAPDLEAEAVSVREEAQQKVGQFLDSSELSDKSKLSLVETKLARQNKLVENREADKQGEIEAYKAWFEEQKATGNSLFNDEFLAKGIKEIEDNYDRYARQSPIIIEELTTARERIAPQMSDPDQLIMPEPDYEIEEPAVEIANPEAEVEQDDATREAITMTHEYVERLSQDETLSVVEKISQLRDEINRMQNVIAEAREAEIAALKEAEDYAATLAPDLLDDWLRNKQEEIKDVYAEWHKTTAEQAEILTTALAELEKDNPGKEDKKPENKEKEKPEERKPKTPEQEKPKVTLEEIETKMRRNREMAENMRGYTAKLRSTCANVSPREPWFRHLQDFDQEHVNRLKNLLMKVFSDADSLNKVRSAVQENKPYADRMFEDISQDLRTDWVQIERELEDATDSNNRLRRRTERDVTHEALDSDNPIRLVGLHLRRAGEDLQSNKNRL